MTSRNNLPDVAKAAASDSIDYGQFYDKINARGKCDDLVLLENVSTDEIVEVRLSCLLRSYRVASSLFFIVSIPLKPHAS